MLDLKTSSFAKILILSCALAVLSLFFVTLATMNTLSQSSEKLRNSYYTDLLQLMVQSPDIEKNLREFQGKFTHFKIDDKPIAVFDEHFRLIFKTKAFRHDWIRMTEVQEAFQTTGISNHYDFLKLFFPSRHYYKGNQPFLVVFVDDKQGDFPKLFQLIFLFFFVSILLCTFFLLIYFFKQVKRKVHELEEVLSHLEGKTKELNTTGFFDRYTRISEVINGLLSTLYISIEQKDKIAKSKFELFSQLTHDIRTPLTSIQTATEILLQGKKLESSQLDSLRSIISMDVEYLRKLVDDLLFLSLLETPLIHQTEFNPMEGMLRALIEKYSASERILQASIVEGELDNVILPRFEFLRLMNNLLSNALRYSKKTIQIEAFRNIDMIVIRVTNDYETLDRKALELYGTKRNQRKIDSCHRQSSIGLGSVIIASIVEKWQGIYKLDINDTQFGVEIQIPFDKFNRQS